MLNTTKTKAALVGLILICFGLGMMVGNAVSNSRKVLLLDATKVQIINNREYDRLHLATCQTDYECQTAQILQDYQDGRLVFRPLESDWQPVYEPPLNEIEQYEEQRAKDKAKLKAVTLEKVN